MRWEDGDGKMMGRVPGVGDQSYVDPTGTC